MEIKKLDQDVELQENVDEEKEGKEIAEEAVKSMETDSSEAKEDSDAEEDKGPDVSVMDQVHVVYPNHRF